MFNLSVSNFHVISPQKILVGKTLFIVTLKVQYIKEYIPF